MDCGIEVADSNADWSKGKNETEQIKKKIKNLNLWGGNRWIDCLKKPVEDSFVISSQIREFY